MSQSRLQEPLAHRLRYASSGGQQARSGTEYSERDRHGLYDLFSQRSKHSLGGGHLCHRESDVARLTSAHKDIPINERSQRTEKRTPSEQGAIFLTQAEVVTMPGAGETGESSRSEVRGFQSFGSRPSCATVQRHADQ